MHLVRGLGREMERLNRMATWSEMVRFRPHVSEGSMASVAHQVQVVAFDIGCKSHMLECT